MAFKADEWVIMQQKEMLGILADRISALPDSHFVCVGIDGVDGAGKTMLGDELAGILAKRGRPVIRASVDGFHNPQTVRYRRGRYSPDGYFLDAYDYAGLKLNLLEPLGHTGSGLYREATFDYRTDSAVASEPKHAALGSVLIFDGIFLHRQELRDHWDFSIFLEIGFDVAMRRCAERDPSFGSAEASDPKNRRYIEAQERYLRECHPQERATVSMDNTDVSSPTVLHARDWPGLSG